MRRYPFKFLQKCEKSNQKNITKKSTKNKKVSGKNTSSNLIDYQNFQFKLAKIRDSIKKMKLQKSSSQSKSNRHNKNQNNQQPNLLKIMLSSTKSGNAKILHVPENQSLREIFTQNLASMRCRSVKTFWPSKTYSLDEKIENFGFINYQVLYVDGDFWFSQLKILKKLGKIWVWNKK